MNIIPEGKVGEQKTEGPRPKRSWKKAVKDWVGASVESGTNGRRSDPASRRQRPEMDKRKIDMTNCELTVATAAPQNERILSYEDRMVQSERYLKQYDEHHISDPSHGWRFFLVWWKTFMQEKKLFSWDASSSAHDQMYNIANKLWLENYLKNL